MASALWPVAALLAGTPAWSACDLQQMDIPVRIIDHRPIATLTLNGTEVPMLVDRGAFFSMLIESTATQLQLRLRNLPSGLRIEAYTGCIAAKLARVEKMGLPGATGGRPGGDGRSTRQQPFGKSVEARPRLGCITMASIGNTRGERAWRRR